MGVVELAQEYGVNNLRFFIPLSRLEHAGIIPGIAFRSHSAPQDTVECVIDESRYRVSEDYKITLRACDPAYGREHYYISDLNSILREREEFRVYVINIDGYSRLSFD